MTSKIKTGTCTTCGTLNTENLRCNCANKTLLDLSPLTPEDRDRAFAQTGQLLSDEDISAILAGDIKFYVEPTPYTPDTLTPKYYGAKCKCGAKLDPYIICDAYATNPSKGSAWHHAVKKLLRAGEGHKPLDQDIQEVIDTLKRWQEQIND